MAMTSRPQADRRSKRSTIGGLAAIASMGVATLLTPFMATIWICDGTCYSYADRPWVVQTFGRWLSEAGWFSGASATELYFAYGRWFVLVYLLLALGLWAFESGQRNGAASSTKAARWAYRLLLASTVVAGAGDGLSYGVGVVSGWAWSVGFGVELLGLLGMTLGSIGYGIAIATSIRGRRWLGWVLSLACVAMPVTLLDRWLVAYMPNAHLLPYTLAWAIVGLHMLAGKPATSTPPAASVTAADPL